MSVLKDESYESIEEILEESTEKEYSTNLDNTSSTTRSEIDDMTLSLLMNKTLYKKYISKNEDPTNEYEEQSVLDNRMYRSKILDITAQMIDSPDLEISYDINNIFLAYTKKIVHYFKMKEVEKQNKYNFYNKEEDDVLFGSIDESNTSNVENSSSFWGKERVVKKGSLPISNYDMRIFSKR